MIAKFKEVNYAWIYLSVLLSFVSYWARAWRWNMLFKPLGYKMSTTRTFLALMIGYVTNFVVPRMGEVTRCGVLLKTDKVPMSTAFGTVLTERAIDMLCLLSVIILTFIIEFRTINQYLIGLFENKLGESNSMVIYAPYALAILLFILLALLYFRQKIKGKLKNNALFLKIRSFLRSLVEGILSIKKIDSPFQFILATALIWLMYFYMSYVVVFAIKETSFLGHGAGLAMLVMGGLGMSAPVQGGIGAYHYLVSEALVLYGVGLNDGIFLAFLLHTSQSFVVIITGLISLVVSVFIRKRNSLQLNVNS